MKFQAIYRVTVYNQDGTVIIGAHEEKDKDGNVRIVQDEAQLTCHFNVSRGVLSDCNRCNIQLYNLAPTTRNRIFQDMFQPFIEKWKFVKLEAGYDNDLSVIFMGRIMQAYSYKSGGQTDVITEIQAQALDMFDRNVSCTFAAGTSYKEALNTMVTTSMPNISVGNVGNLEGTFQTPTTFEGGAMANINKLCGGNAFIDNNQLNVIMSNEVIDVPVPVINETNGLLDTPNRRDANLEVKMLFEPKLIVGQLLQIESKVQTDFNGQYKIVGITHDCLISGTQAGKRTTTVNLYIGPFLPGAEIIVSGQKQNNFNKVKGTEVTPVNVLQQSLAFVKPINGVVSSKFGYRKAPKSGASSGHKGIDIAAPVGSNVWAAAAGVVTGRNTDPKGYGYYMDVDHGIVNSHKMMTRYAHLSRFIATVGQKVDKHQIIASSGNTGNTTGPHLHFELRIDGTPVNPQLYMNI